jgi:hypothetical protein
MNGVRPPKGSTHMRALVAILIPDYDAEEWVSAAIGSAFG